MSYDRDEWRTPWRLEDVGRSQAEPADTADEPPPAGDAPLTRFPQAPPSSWSAGANGPGSPAGSVRPPDTTGTVEAPATQGRRGGAFLIAVVGGLIGALIGAGAMVVLTDREAPPIAGAQDPVTSAPIEIDGDPLRIVPAVAAAVTPSVVVIQVDAGTPGEQADPFDPGGGQALGSGVIYRSDGYIVTNAHVVGDAQTVEVRLTTGEPFEGEVLGTDPLNDLAVVKIEASDLPRISLRPDIEELLVGETVVAIGSPFGLDASVTAGIVSGLNRDLHIPEEQVSIPMVIQTDAAINPGNSGGALVDAQGRLVGINTAIFTRTGGNQGIGFAVPAGQMVVSADQIIDQGFVRHALLGVLGQSVTREIAERFALESRRGALVQRVEDGSGAAEAGVREGDLIIEVDGEELVSMSELVAAVRQRTPGDVMQLTVLRNGDRISLDVVLGERPR